MDGWIFGFLGSCLSGFWALLDPWAQSVWVFRLLVSRVCGIGFSGLSGLLDLCTSVFLGFWVSVCLGLLAFGCFMGFLFLWSLNFWKQSISDDWPLSFWVSGLLGFLKIEIF